MVTSALEEMCGFDLLMGRLTYRIDELVHQRSGSFAISQNIL